MTTIVEPDYSGGSIINEPGYASKTEGSSATNSSGIVEPNYAAKTVKRTSTPSAGVTRGPLLDPGASAVMRGLTFGLSDRLGAHAMAWKTGRPYEDVLKQQLADRDAYAHDHPIGNLGSEIFGGLLTAPLGGSGFLNAAKEMPALGRGVLSLLGGAGAGGVYGASQAQPGQELKGAVNGATTGALTTGALSALGGVGKFAANKGAPIIQGIGNFMGLTSPEQWADKAIKKSLMKDETTLPQVANNLWSVSGRDLVNPRTGAPANAVDAILLDAAGPSLAARAKKALQRDTSAKLDLDNLISGRNAAQPSRIADAIRASISPRTDGVTAGNEIAQQFLAQAAPHFEQAKALGQIGDPAVMDWFRSSPARMQMFQNLKEQLRGHGTPMGATVGTLPNGRQYFQKAPTVDDLLQVKQHLDDIRSSLWDHELQQPIPGGVAKTGSFDTNYGQATENLKSFRDMLDKVTSPDPNDITKSPLFKGRAIAGEGFDVKNALKRGSNFSKMSADQLQNAWNALDSDASKEAFRIGVASNLFDKSQKMGDNSVTTRVAAMYGNPDIRNKLDIVFPDGSAKDYFSKMVGGTEKNLADTARTFAPSAYGSTSGEGGVPGGLMQTAVGMWAGSPRSTWQGIKNTLNEASAGMADANAEALLRRLMMNPDEVKQYAAKMASQQGGPLSAISSAAGSTMPMLPYVLGGIAGGSNDSNPLANYIDLGNSQ